MLLIGGESIDILDGHFITDSTDSQATQTRATNNNVHLVPTDVALVSQSDYIFSIVPPRDALATAQRIATASKNIQRENPFYFVDLNAISPHSARHIASLFPTTGPIHYLDGGIIGAPPSLQPDGTWKRPSLPVSGPYNLGTVNPHLAQTLNIKHINNDIGAATGLKMCFASLTKGHTALAIQSFTTASRLGVLPALKESMAEFNPAGLKHAEASLPGMCPKAYRWVEEMRQIGETFSRDGGFEESEDIFAAVAAVYAFVAQGTELGREVVGDRKEGTTAEDVARLMGESLERRKVKTD